jgi:hypothetical protein
LKLPEVAPDYVKSGICSPDADDSLDAFCAADNRVDTEFVAELKRITERARQELAALARASKPAS